MPTRSPRARWWLAALAWALAAVAATVVGMTAVGAIGSGLLGAAPEPLSATEVDRALAAARALPLPPAPAAPTSAADPAPPAANDVLSSPGGTVVARCTGGAVEVVSASPAQGFWLDHEPERARVKFESEQTEVEIRLGCRDGRPVGAVEIDD